MNVSKPQHRTLHALAQGGQIIIERDERGAIIAADCITRDGWVLTDCNLMVFKSLKQKRLIASRDSQPYRITKEGLKSLRSQLDNRTVARAF